MKDKRSFGIEILKLENGRNHFEFDIESSFFEDFKDSFLEKGKLKASLTLDNSETMIQANFVINGYVELICDRSLENFDYQISINENLIFKFGDEFSELTEEILTIPRNLQTLNVAQYIYEFIGLAVPMKKLHPRFIEDEDKNPDLEGILIYTTKSGKDEEDSDTESTKDIDPRWDILNKLKKNNN